MLYDNLNNGIMKNLTFVAFVTIICGIHSATAQNVDQNLITEFANSWADVSSSGDIDKFMNFFDDDAIIFTSDNPTSGSVSIRSVYTSYFEKYKLEVSILVKEVEIYDDKAYVWSRLEGTNQLKEGDEIKKIAFNHIWILKKEAATWKFWRVIFTPASTSQ